MSDQKIIKSATFIGEEREGGYIFLHSSDLPGFTLMLQPGEDNVETVIEVLKPALTTYLNAYQRYEANQKANRNIVTSFKSADVSGIHKGKPMNLVAEFCAA